MANDLKMFKTGEADEEFYENKLIALFDSSFEILKFMNGEIQDLISKNQFSLIFKLLKIIIDHINEELKYGDFPLIVEIIDKIDSIITQLRDSASTDDISDFLDYAISSSDDYFILDILGDCMSRNGDR